MIAFRGQKSVGPCPDLSPLGVLLKISDEHPHPFHMRSPPPPPRAWGVGKAFHLLSLSLLFLSLSISSHTFFLSRELELAQLYAHLSSE